MSTATGAVFWLTTTAIGDFLIGLFGLRVALCVGDSHVRPLSRCWLRALSRGEILHVVSVSGATGSGLPNPNSKTQAGKVFTRYAMRLRASGSLIVGLGEVDAGFLVFLRSEVSGLPAREHTDQALNRFFDFLASVSSRGLHRTVVIGVVPPTVVDYATWDGLAGARRGLSAAYETRKQETRYWNEQCAAYCQTTGAEFVEMFDRLLDANGLVKSHLLGADQADHHLADAAYALMAGSQIWP